MNSEADGGSSLKGASSVFAQTDVPSIRQVLTVLNFFFSSFLGFGRSMLTSEQCLEGLPMGRVGLRSICGFLETRGSFPRGLN